MCSRYLPNRQRRGEAGGFDSRLEKFSVRPDLIRIIPQFSVSVAVEIRRFIFLLKINTNTNAFTYTNTYTRLKAMRSSLRGEGFIRFGLHLKSKRRYFTWAVTRKDFYFYFFIFTLTLNRTANDRSNSRSSFPSPSPKDRYQVLICITCSHRVQSPFVDLHIRSDTRPISDELRKRPRDLAAGSCKWYPTCARAPESNIFYRNREVCQGETNYHITARKQQDSPC